MFLVDIFRVVQDFCVDLLKRFAVGLVAGEVVGCASGDAVPPIIGAFGFYEMSVLFVYAVSKTLRCGCP